MQHWKDWLDTVEYSRPSNEPGFWGNVKRWYQRRRMLRGWAKLYERGAHDTVHLFELLRSMRKARLPMLDLAALVEQVASRQGANPEQVRVHPALFSAGSGSVGEVSALALLAAAQRPRQVLEFGTYDGFSTWHFWANAPEDALITTIDLPAATKVSGSTDSTLQGISHRVFLPPDPRVRVVEIDSRQWIPDLKRPVNLCFIDAGHSYECVRSDTEKVLPLMAPDGLLVWHDATWRRDGYGVNRYLRELRQQGQPIHLLRLSLYDYCGIAVLLPEA